MTAVTITLAQTSWTDGVTPILLQAIYDDVTNLVSTVQVSKPTQARPTLVVKDGTTLATILDITVGPGTLVTRDVSAAGYHIQFDGEIAPGRPLGNILIPWQIQFG